jgi:hypothetical protein
MLNPSRTLKTWSRVCTALSGGSGARRAPIQLARRPSAPAPAEKIPAVAHAAHGGERYVPRMANSARARASAARAAAAAKAARRIRSASSRRRNAFSNDGRADVDGCGKAQASTTDGFDRADARTALTPSPSRGTARAAMGGERELNPHPGLTLARLRLSAPPTEGLAPFPALASMASWRPSFGGRPWRWFESTGVRQHLPHGVSQAWRHMEGHQGG